MSIAEMQMLTNFPETRTVRVGDYTITVEERILDQWITLCRTT
jgi:hypothetical protein